MNVSRRPCATKLFLLTLIGLFAIRSARAPRALVFRSQAQLELAMNLGAVATGHVNWGTIMLADCVQYACNSNLCESHLVNSSFTKLKIKTTARNLFLDTLYLFLIWLLTKLPVTKQCQYSFALSTMRFSVRLYANCLPENSSYSFTRHSQIQFLT